MYRRRGKVFYFNDSNVQRIKNTSHQLKSKNLRKRRNILTKCNALKTIFFIICLISFFYFSVSYLIEFYKYPTKTTFAVTNPKEFKMPCITFCNNNIIKRSKFCKKYPYLCSPPKNLTQFCLDYRHMCSKNTSNLVIPLFNPYFVEKKELTALFKNRKLSLKTWSTWTWDIPNATYQLSFERNMTTSLVRGLSDKVYSTCYSANMRFSNKLLPLTWPINSPTRDFNKMLVEGYYFEVDEDESFYPPLIPQVSLVIHSPFVPVTPLTEGMPLETGFIYFIAVKLEENHLLPYPYETDCIDYDALWEKNNKTGPRSQEVCEQWCLWNNFTRCKEFHSSAMMVEYSENMCKLNSKNQMEPKECMKNCKADCIQLRFSYKVTKMPVAKKIKRTAVFFSVDDPQVVVRSHIPLYDAGDLFSHIGGLMGCWLGVSVTTFAGILVNAFTKLKHLTSKFLRNVG